MAFKSLGLHIGSLSSHKAEGLWDCGDMHQCDRLRIHMTWLCMMGAVKRLFTLKFPYAEYRQLRLRLFLRRASPLDTVFFQLLTRQQP